MTTATRGRRSPRPTGDERQSAILTTLEDLLGRKAFSDISIDDLARGAGISRPTFYFYFPGKEAVLLSLVDRVIAGIDVTPLISDLPEDPVQQWRAAIDLFFSTFRDHRAVTLACASMRGQLPEVEALWSGVMQGWVALTAQTIQAERDRGAAPEGVAAQDLAVSLNLLNERMMLAAFAGEQPGIAEDRVVDVLLAMWLTAIYGTTEVSVSSRSRRRPG